MEVKHLHRIGVKKHFLVLFYTLKSQFTPVWCTNGGKQFTLTLGKKTLAGVILHFEKSIYTSLVYESRQTIYTILV
jgi:hypothetical protein